MTPICGGKFYELFCPDAKENMRYKYRIYKKNVDFTDHSDPYGFGCELRPDVCSVIRSMTYEFSDDEWLENRTDCKNKPLNIYEVHLGSWRKPKNGGCEWYNYAEIADELIDWVKDNGYNYIEIMPLGEHPCDESWGYQGTGFFAPTSRYGTAVQLMNLVDKCHQKGIGVIMDFVPVHFAVNDYALANYDGTALYEYPSDDVGYNEWGSRNFNHAKGEVQSFLKSAAAYWLDLYHFDGIRVDAVRNLIYWQGDERRGENRNGINFLRTMNTGLKMLFPTAIIAAEDSTAYPNVTKSAENGGLGFDYKWDMGWMNDTLEFFGTSVMYRSRGYHKLTFSMKYFENEQFILPLSHDEVVHGKGSILRKMKGNDEDRFSQARALYLYMYAHSGKKLNFMGNEIGQLSEWNEKNQLDWELLENPENASFNRFIKAINHMYLSCEPLHLDYEKDNFKWLDCDSEEDCIYAFLRRGNGENIVAMFNFSDWKKSQYTVKIGDCTEVGLLIDTDLEQYGGNSENSGFSCENGRLTTDLKPFSGKLFKFKNQPLNYH